jgi:DNA polymerase
MSDLTRFDLDDRQRAMLAEMGVRVWWPQRNDAALQALADQAPAVAATVLSPALGLGAKASVGTASPVRPSPPVSANPPPRHEPVAKMSASMASADLVQAPAQAFEPLPEGLSGMTWTELQTAVKGCKACALCAARQTPILGSGHGAARWMVVGDFPSESDEQQDQPFTGPEGVLLDNMLKAVGVRRQGFSHLADTSADQPEACLTHAVKCRPLNGRNPDSGELMKCAGYLSRQVALAQPRVILAMGRFAIQSLLGSAEPMGKLRGRLHDFQGVPVVVTYPPASLLRNPADKAKAWADLVLALSVAKA